MTIQTTLHNALTVISCKKHILEIPCKSKLADDIHLFKLIFNIYPLSHIVQVECGIVSHIVVPPDGKGCVWGPCVGARGPCRLGAWSSMSLSN